MTGKTRRWQRVIAVICAMMVVFIANRRLKIEAADTPEVRSIAPSPVVEGTDTDAAQMSATHETSSAQESDTGLTAAHEALPPETVTESALKEAAQFEAASPEVPGAGKETQTEHIAAKAGRLIDFDAPYPYYIYVNRAANTVTVVGIDENGNYTIPYKAFVCSASENTIIGTFTTSRGQEWGSLIGGVYAQYSTRIAGPYLFHSVPYLRYGDKSSLETEEYNKLGTLASAGCIRLTVEDAKWIYDNCPAGTYVRIYDDEEDPGRLGKPEPVTIDPDAEGSGWDPTDPDPSNPWQQEEEDNTDK